MHSTINCRGQLLSIKVPLVMGILNITPDSFFDGGKHNTINSAILQSKKMLTQGADIIDIGAYSSRPGAGYITESEEIKRLIPVIEAILIALPKAIISVDTFRAKVAEMAIKSGAAIINDISAGEDDAKMMATVARLAVPYIMMHKKGSPQLMQENPEYSDIVKEIMLFFAKKTEQAKRLGINDVLIDPGFGFGKTLQHNYELLNSLEKFKIFELPIMVGLSRKSMIYNVLKSGPQDALAGTIALNTVALQKGASILRVHDVKEAVDTVKLVGKIEQHDSWDIIDKYS